MKKTYQAALAVLAVMLAACQAGPAASGSPEAVANSVMEFELASLDGTKLSPGDAGETLTLVDFWATWCGPCHLQADILAKLYPELREKGVEFLAVSLGESEEVVRDFVAKRPFAYPVLVDPADTIATSYGLFVLPTVVLLDRDGTVLYLREGISTASRLRSAVDEILESRTGPAARRASEGSRTAS
jgi:thiol-disulfide isomerase/thioredoxin